MDLATADKLLGFDDAPIGLAVTRERVIGAVNKRMTEIFGHARGDLEGQTTSVLYPSNRDFVEIGRIGRHRMRHDGRYADERIMQRKDGSLFWCRVTGRARDAAHPFRCCTWSFTELAEVTSGVRLTPRERHVAMQLLAGLDTKTIARDLGISPRTVEIHRSNLLRKYGVGSTPELIGRIARGPA